MANFGEAKVGEDAPVWVCPTGDDFSWVSEPEWFEDADEPVTVTRQTWRLESEIQVRWHPSTELCPACGGLGEDESRQRPDGSNPPCLECDGDGRHPLAGTWEELG